MGKVEDPLVSFHFMLEVAGTLSGLFTNMSGLGSENEVVEHKVIMDGKKQAVRMIPGRLKWNPISLKRGITSNFDIWDWRQAVVDGKVTDARKAATITAFNQSGEPVAKWNLVAAWPSKVSGPEFDSASGNVMVEELTIVCEGFTRVKP